MIFFTVNQLYSFCLILFCGIICCVFNSFLGVFLIKNHQNKIFKFIFKLFLSLIFSIFLIFSINSFYFGQYNIVLILAFAIGFLWCEKTLHKSLDFLELKFYYIYIKLIRRLTFYHESKHQSISD